MADQSLKRPTLRLATWAARIPRGRLVPAYDEAEKGVQDLIGCMLAGINSRVPKLVASLAISQSSGPCTLVGYKEKVSASAAALANAAASHVQDYDDTFRPLTGHPSCVIVPAILAVAEEHKKTTVDFLDAYIVGIEIAASLGRVSLKHRDAGWHATSTTGIMAAAAACGRLLELNMKQIVAAISISFSNASGSRVQIGTDTKRLHPGFAARDAVNAAYLAAAGVEGCSEVLSGHWTWLDLYSGASTDSAEDFTVPTSHTPLAIVEPGLTFKLYPTCGSSHRTLDAVLDLCRTHDLKAADIASVETIVSALNYKNLRYDKPATGVEGKFSMPYCCALAIRNRAIRLNDFTDEGVQDLEVQGIMAKIKRTLLPGSQDSREFWLNQPCITTIQMQTGETFKDARYARRGEATKPMSVEDMHDKFLDCASISPLNEEGTVILKAIHSLHSSASISCLTDLLRI